MSVKKKPHTTPHHEDAAHSGKHAVFGDIPEKDPSRLAILFQRGFRFMQSPHGVTLSLGVSLLLLLVGILSLDYFSVVRVALEGVSSQTVHASYTFTVTDDEATNRKRELAKNSVPPIYESEAVINESIREDLLNLVSSLASWEREWPAVSKTNKTGNIDPAYESKRFDAFKTLFEDSQLTQLVYYQHFGNKEKHHRESDWQHYQILAQVTLDRALKNGISTTDFFENRDQIIQNALPKIGILPKERGLVALLVSNVMQPNKVVDEEAMVKARALAVSKVESVTRTFHKGESIVEKGDTLSPIQITALEKLGKIGFNWSAFLGIFIFCILSVSILWTYLYIYEDQQYFTPSFAALMLVMCLLTIGGIKLFLQYEDKIPLYAFPLASFGLILSVFSHPRIGVLTSMILCFLAGYTLKADFFPLIALLISTLSGVFVLNQRMNVADRSQLLQATVAVCVTNVIVIGAIYLVNVNAISSYSWQELLMLGGWGVLSGLGSGALSFGLLPFLESLFHLVTPFTLMELSNHDQPLLRRMQFEAPGTFHHSLMVASLAETAAEAIGANPLLTRVGALYHDIGKLKRPLFFIENQAYFGVENPHDRLTPRLSKMIITAHTRDGVEMAKQVGIPYVIQKFMTEHHGTMVVGYFYNQACIEEGEENVDKAQFRYAGPKPNIKETAVVMLADACESAIRSLKSPNVAQIEEKVSKLFKQRIDDGQFDNCPITFKDLNTIQETFVRVIRGIRHDRIEYQDDMLKEFAKRRALAEQQAQQQLLQNHHAHEVVLGQAAQQNGKTLPPPPLPNLEKLPVTKQSVERPEPPNA